MHVCYWYGMLVGGKKIRKTYTCETESIAKSIERGLSKHSVYVVESRVYEVDNNDDDIVYFEPKRPLPIPYNPKKISFNSSHRRLSTIELNILDAYKDLLELQNEIPYSYDIKSYLRYFEDVNYRIMFYKKYKSHLQRFAY